MTTSKKSFLGVKRAYGVLFSYIISVIESLGSDKALEILKEIVQKRGREDGLELKRRLGVVNDNIFDGYAVYSAFIQDSGMNFDVIEENEEKIVLRIGKCPVFEASHEAIVDCQYFGERMCRLIYLPLASAVVSVINPNLSVDLVRYRTFHDGYCIEDISLKEK
jgi:hypothetical protein